MSHQESATLQFGNACREMLKDASERIDRIMEVMHSTVSTSGSLMDDGIRSMIADLEGAAADVRRSIDDRMSTMDEVAYRWQIGETRSFLSVVNSMVLRADALNKAFSEALDSGRKSVSGHRDMDAYLEGVEDGNVRRMMVLLSRNPKHDDLSLDELRELAECRVDPSRKVNRRLITDTVEDIRASMTEEKVSSDVIEGVVGDGTSVSPLEMMDSATSEIMDERLRRSAVQAIVKCISTRGFVVRKENIRHIRETDTVKITAMKPGGQKAEFSIDLKGRFVYHFQGYEGSACEKDISPLERDLEEIYGIRMTDRETLWVNPDKIKTQYHAEMKVRRDG